jgi:hypothetical protein
MSETTVERLKRLNNAAGQNAPLTATEEWWSIVAGDIDEAFGDGVRAMSDYELGYIVGGVVGRIMTHKKESK